MILTKQEIEYLRAEDKLIQALHYVYGLSDDDVMRFEEAFALYGSREVYDRPRVILESNRELWIHKNLLVDIGTITAWLGIPSNWRCWNSADKARVKEAIQKVERVRDLHSRSHIHHPYRNSMRGINIMMKTKPEILLIPVADILHPNSKIDFIFEPILMRFKNSAIIWIAVDPVAVDKIGYLHLHAIDSVFIEYLGLNADPRRWTLSQVMMLVETFSKPEKDFFR